MRQLYLYINEYCTFTGNFMLCLCRICSLLSRHSLSACAHYWQPLRENSILITGAAAYCTLTHTAARCIVAFIRIIITVVSSIRDATSIPFRFSTPIDALIEFAHTHTHTHACAARAIRAIKMKRIPQCEISQSQRPLISLVKPHTLCGLCIGPMRTSVARGLLASAKSIHSLVHSLWRRAKVQCVRARFYQ